MKELIVVSTGSSINNYKDHLRAVQHSVDILSWSFSYLFLNKIGVTPEFFSFIDPHSAIEPIKKIVQDKKDVPTLFFKDIVGESYQKQQEYIGTSQMMGGIHPHNYEEKYSEYLALVNSTRTINIKSTTIKKLKNEMEYPEEYINSLDDTNARDRFVNDIVIMGMSTKKWRHDQHDRYMNLYQDKLTMSILPLCHYIGYKKVNLIGFDGRGGRFFKLNQSNGVPDMQESYRAYLPLWINAWKKYHGMDIFTLNNEQESILTDYMPSRQFQELI